MFGWLKKESNSHNEPAVVNDTAVATVFQIGDVLGDQTVFAGEVNGKKIYVAPQNAQYADGTNLTMTFSEAADYAKKLNAENYLGHNDWHIPTREELNVLHENKDKGALKNAFNLTGSGTAGYFWSSTPGDKGTYALRFSDGRENYIYRSLRSSVRCVR